MRNGVADGITKHIHNVGSALHLKVAFDFISFFNGSSEFVLLYLCVYFTFYVIYAEEEIRT